ncbi:MAG: hypothetical protein ACOX33_01325 [Dethiobacteria bacterium]
MTAWAARRARLLNHTLEAIAEERMAEAYALQTGKFKKDGNELIATG